MTAFAISLPRDVSAIQGSIDLSQVRSSHGWVLRFMRADGPALVRLLWRMLGREQDVLDAYQDTFCRLIGMGDSQSTQPPRGYIFRTAMNIALDMRRRRKVRVEHLEAAALVRTAVMPDPSAVSPGSQSLVEELRQAIEELPQRLRDVVVLRDLAEMSYGDVARILGITGGTARVYRREAIVALAARLKEC